MPDFRHEALRRLFIDSHRSLRRYVLRLVGSQETAEDIVQEAFLRTYQHGERVVTPRALLFAAARNLAIDARRRAEVMKTDSLSVLDQLAGQSSANGGLETPETRAISDERSQLLKAAVERLPPQCRAAFTLRVFHGCSYQEIAVQLSISVKTVEKHIGRGLHDVHRYLRRRYIDAGPRQ
jgi:RNA polymerase sigma-70 factor, ECF subfamily